MKQTVISRLAVICLLVLLLAVLLPAIPAHAAETDINTKTYYYDKLNDRQKRFYQELKNYYDNLPDDYLEHDVDFTHMLPTNPTDEDCDKCYLDYLYAELALIADQPQYEWRAHTAYCGWRNDDVEICFTATIVKRDIYTVDSHQRAEARIQQIVDTIGAGDRYTKLRKLTHYLMTNTFYDPYSSQISSVGNNSALASRGIFYDCCAYGLLLENVAVCSGFADSVKILCDRLDVPCIIMGNVGHAWNLVQMEDGKWYRLDLTMLCSLGWDGSPGAYAEILDVYFLNNNVIHSFGYDNPYMLSIDGAALVTEFPEHAYGQYQYTGSTTDFSYAVVPSTYTPCAPTFSYRVNVDGKTCTITNYEGPESGDLVIPGEIDGYAVTAIDPFAFYYRSDFTGKLIIPDTVESIGKAAFACCYGLTSVELPANLHKIGIGAFIGCKRLTEVVLPDLVDEVGAYAFYDCRNLCSAVFGSHIQAIGEEAFNDTKDGLTMKGPAGSAAQIYALENGISFQTAGTLCDFVDVDGKWEFTSGDGMFEYGSHFHTCRHGGRFDYGAHISDHVIPTIFNCGNKCIICRAEYCNVNGMVESLETTLVNKKPATCYDPAYSGDLACACGIILQVGHDYGDPRGHIPGPEGTCSIAQTCIDCGWVFGYDYSKHNWVYSDSYSTDPTCTSNGYKIYICKDCSSSSFEEIFAYGHDEQWHDGKEPTCTENGYYMYWSCTRCDATSYQEIAPNPYNHDWIDYPGKEPTCTEKGHNPYRTCRNCNYTTYKIISAYGHDEQWHDGKEPTCTENGYYMYWSCTRCDATSYQEIAPDPYNHDLIDYPGKEPTCTEKGHNPYTTCRNCDYTTYMEIPPSHSLVRHPPKGVTCTEAGHEAYYTCRNCDYTTYQEIPPRHSLVNYAARPATCTEWGREAYEACRYCDYTTYQAIPPSHSLKNYPAKAATCTEAGYEAYQTCRNCDYTTYKEIPPSHSLENHPAKAATCAEKGHKAYQACKNCSYSTYEEIPTTDHTYVSHGAKAATCTEKGNKAYQTCENCSYSTYEEIPTTDHTYVSHEAKAAMCTEKGNKAYQTCRNCTYTTYEEIPATGHTYVDHGAKAATCTEVGHNAYQTCQNCDYTTFEEISATGKHTYGEWETVKEATHKTAGEQKQTCTLCGYIVTAQIPMLEGMSTWQIAAVAGGAVVLIALVVLIVVKKRKP